jgi:hypothetical protein
VLCLLPTPSPPSRLHQSPLPHMFCLFR